MRHAQQAATESLLTLRQTEAALASDLVLAFGASRLLSDPPLEARHEGGSFTVWIEDVAGLIDVNTAHPALLAALRDELGLARQAGALTGPAGSAYDSLDGFALAHELGPDRRSRLAELATVHSRRPGLSEEDVPPALRLLLTRSRLWSAQGLPAELRSGPTYQTYRVLVRSGQRRRAVATVRLPSSVQGRQVLSFH